MPKNQDLPFWELNLNPITMQTPIRYYDEELKSTPITNNSSISLVLDRMYPIPNKPYNL
ncbi:hypothetical protein [Mangrovimonas cancribranchiae]|uniref:Uncharacterized protein n=1 Tax=Mangrovimonas cancribranchiae TaxID=3080055 RepID=A0AAU6NWZ2_9FLAO